MTENIKLITEITCLLVGGLFGSLVGSHFKTGEIQPWKSRIMSVIAAFLIIWFLLDHNYIEYSRKSFSIVAGIAFAIEIIGQHEISLLVNKFIKSKLRRFIDEKKK